MAHKVGQTATACHSPHRAPPNYYYGVRTYTWIKGAKFAIAASFTFTTKIEQLGRTPFIVLLSTRQQAERSSWIRQSSEEGSSLRDNLVKQRSEIEIYSYSFKHTHGEIFYNQSLQASSYSYPRRTVQSS